MSKNEAIKILRSYDISQMELDLKKLQVLSDAYETTIEALEIMQEYEKIGTVSECMEAVSKCEKLIPHRIVLYNGEKGYECASCGNNIPWGVWRRPYCAWCGHSIQWEK